MDQSFHGSDDQLEGYLLGRLSESDFYVLEEHLLVCTACRERLETTENFVLAVRESLTNESPLGHTHSPSIDWFGWLRKPAFSLAFASLALAAVVAVLLGRGTALAPIATLQLTAIRGEMPSIPPAREVDLTLSDVPSQSGASRVEIVDATGGAVWNGVAVNTGGGARVKAQQRFGPGEYFVRLYSPAGQLLHEYGFTIRR